VAPRLTSVLAGSNLVISRGERTALLLRQFDLEFGPPTDARELHLELDCNPNSDLLGPNGQTPLSDLRRDSRRVAVIRLSIPGCLSYTVGRHTFKAGADVALLTVRDISRSTTVVNYCSARRRFTGLANFIDDLRARGID